MTALRRYRAAAERYLTQLARRSGLHTTDVSALSHLMDCARLGRVVSPGELGHMLALSGPATTAVIDRLEKAGYVERRHSAVDGRRIELHLSPGIEPDPGTTILAPLGAALRDGLAGFTPEQMAIFEVMLTTLGNHLDAEAAALEERAAAERITRLAAPRSLARRPRHELVAD